MYTVNEIIDRHYPQVSNKPWLSAPLKFCLKKLLHEKDIQQFKHDYPHCYGLEFVEQVLEFFEVSYSCRDNEKERIPSNGRVVIIANHPVGSLDGLALLKLISEVRDDVKVVANEMLMAFEPLHELLLPVNNMQGGTPKACLVNIDKHLQNEGALIVFPAGEVSRLRPQGVRDTVWHKGFLRMATKAQAPILPIKVTAKNSATFYGMSMIYKPLSTMFLVKEMFKQRCNHFPMRIGELIAHQTYANNGIHINQQVKLFKKHLYRIGTNKALIFESQKAIALPEGRQKLRKDIKKYCQVLGETQDGKIIYLYQHNKSSSIMREIGRLREVSFRAVGEGCNKRRDIDAYDSHYFHLILWDKDDLEIAGAYRLANATKVYAENMLYSATLFDYSPKMQQYFSQGLELGRSFVQPKYWGKRSLDYLWYGIGAYLQKNPQYRYMIGAVSLSNSYPQAAKELIVQFYQRHFSSDENLAKAMYPFAFEQNVTHENQEIDYQEEFVELKHKLASMGTTVPTLYKQYADLCKPGGVKFLDFNVDPDFNYCIDGLVLLDLHYLKDKKRQRYLPETIQKTDAA